MAGKEHQGIDAADADLFKGKPWVIAPDVNAPEAAVNTVIGLVQATGANPSSWTHRSTTATSRR